MCFLFFSACKNDFASDYSLEILSPKENWTYTTDSEILFSCNVKGDGLVWESSVEGEIGNGSEFSKKLRPGTHKITLKDLFYNKQTSVIIAVSSENQNNLTLITDFPFIFDESDRKKTNSNSGIIALDGSAQILEFQLGKNQTECDLQSLENQIFKDVAINNEISTLKLLQPGTARNVTQESTNRKKFFVVNTADSYSDAHEVYAEKFYEDERITVWIPENYNFDRKLLKQVVENLQEILLKRVNQLWGDCADVNRDGTFALLFSPTINDEKVAVGFFNSADFFENNNDLSSKSCNPYSNEMDLLYIAIPEENSRNYNVNSITATIIHEYTHAINFTNKTWKKISEGKSDVFQEETFLDEGWSHLTESLCGYGISGGNCDFVNLYLENMNLYSFCKKNYLGNSDSAGQRGAMCLFLYYLFNKAGGVEYSSDYGFIDNGGISFLQTMINSSTFGWNSIGEYFSKTTDYLFLEFAQEILTKNLSEIFDFTLKDPSTNENIFTCKNPKFQDFSKTITVLPYSLTVFDLCDSYVQKINGKNLKGTVYFHR